jgi:nucleotide-binding universal stress UspA family protein
MAADLPAAAPLGAPPAVVAVGVDGSEESLRAVMWALALARALAARLVLVHGTGLLEGAGLQPAVDLDHQLASALARLGPGGDAGAASARPAPDVRLRRRPGDSVDVLLAVAAEEGADLLVLGRRGVGRTVGTLGSTSAAVVAASTVPVVVLPPAP